MTQPLSLAALWRDTFADTRALLPLAWPVAAAFVLLPGIAADLFGPPLPRTPAGLTANVVVVDLIAPALVGIVAQLTIIRLCLDRRRGVARSVGEALTVALRTWPVAIVALLATAVPIGCGMVVLVLPGLYLAGRLTPAAPFIADGTGPIVAIERAWALTEGNGWRTIGFTLLFVGWFVVLSAVAGAVGAGAAVLLKSAGAGAAGAVVASALDGAVAALFTVVNAVAVATVYRTLRA